MLKAHIKLVDHKAYRGDVRAFFGGMRGGVKVGVFGSEGDSQKSGPSDAQGNPTPPAPGALTVAQIASFHEFGLGVPERSFIRSYFDANRGALVDYAIFLMRRAVAKAIKSGRLINDADRKRVLSTLGLRMVRDIKERIVEKVIYQNLAESTLAQKTRGGKVGNTALVDTSQLLNSIHWARLRE